MVRYLHHHPFWVLAKKMKSIHVLLVACVIAASQGGMVKELRLGGPNPNTMSFTCLLEHCAGQMAKAFIDVKFMEEAKCEMGCTYFPN